MNQPHDRQQLRIAIVGPCASGKTTLAAALQRHGYRAYVSGQEHSEITTLWNHLHPDAVIALDLDLETLRQRRGPEWPESIYEKQQARLREAKAAALLTIDTARHDQESTLRLALDAISGYSRAT